jgi:DNA replication protein DnaC
MLTHPTLDRLIALGLTGMAKAFDDQRRQPDVAALPFEDRLAIMIDREVVERQNKCLATRLKFAGLRHMAVVEDIDLATPRGLDRTLFTSLVAGDWIERKLNLLIIGPTGVGKSWIACALGHKACRAPSSITACRGCSKRWRCPRRWPLRASARPPGPRGVARPRRLGARPNDRRAAP